MKATIEFNLPEDRPEHVRCVNALNAWRTLAEIDEAARSAYKHNPSEEVRKFAEELRREYTQPTLAILGE